MWFRQRRDGCIALDSDMSRVIFSIPHRFIDLRHVGVSVDRVSHKDASAKQAKKCRDRFNHSDVP